MKQENNEPSLEWFLDERAASLSDREILQIMLRRAMKQEEAAHVSEVLLQYYQSLPNVLNASYAELKYTVNLSERAAALICVMVPLFRRIMLAKIKKGPLDTEEKLYAALQPRFLGEKREVVFLLCLDSRKKLIKCYQIADGDALQTGLPIKKAIGHAIECDAEYVVLSHNHPDGDPTPSDEDIEATAAFRNALKNVGIKLQDHIICGENGYTSVLSYEANSKQDIILSAKGFF